MSYLTHAKSFFAFAFLLSLMALAACSPTSQATIAPTSAPTTEATSEPTVESAPTTEATSDSTAESASADETAEVTNEVVTAACTLLNLNTVTEEELLSTMPNFSNRMVREFFEYRPYVSIQQFRREIGKYVDDAQVAEWEQYVYVPIAVNEADADTLMQLAGVDETIAATLIAGRPYASNDAFITVLTPLISADELAQADCYLGDA